MNTKGVEDGNREDWSNEDLRITLAAPVESPEELPPLPKPIRTSEFWDGGIEWALAGERAARLERERQLKQCMAENKRLLSAAVPVEERTVEMEQLMGRLRELAMRATQGPYMPSPAACGKLMKVRGGLGKNIADLRYTNGEADTAYFSAASPDVILRLLDHIEGKAKAVSQEVKE